jgi:SAM-dependent methyltransferase
MAPFLEAAGPKTLLSLIGDEENLPFGQERFELAVSALALQNLNDLPGALLQLRRALKPDGLFLGCLLGGATLNELRKALAAAEAEFWGGVSPRVSPFADVRDLGGLLQRAGFALPVADSDTLTIRYANLFALMADLRPAGQTSGASSCRLYPNRSSVARGLLRCLSLTVARWLTLRAHAALRTSTRHSA